MNIYKIKSTISSGVRESEYIFYVRADDFLSAAKLADSHITENAESQGLLGFFESLECTYINIVNLCDD